SCPPKHRRPHLHPRRLRRRLSAAAPDREHLWLRSPTVGRRIDDADPARFPFRRSWMRMTLHERKGRPTIPSGRAGVEGPAGRVQATNPALTHNCNLSETCRQPPYALLEARRTGTHRPDVSHDRPKPPETARGAPIPGPTWTQLGEADMKTTGSKL